MEDNAWTTLLIVGLAFNAALGLGYRAYRLGKGGPRADVIGQAILGVLLLALAVALGLGAGWPRWVALGYGLVFGVLVMPVWVLAVLIPLPPRGLDYAFTGIYWVTLGVVVVAALAL